VATETSAAPAARAQRSDFAGDLAAQIDRLKQDGVYKRLNYLDSPQSARVRMEGRGDVLILSSNNYLGLCDDPSVVAAGIEGLRRFGAGTGTCRRGTPTKG
jgi:glycine C-acetyltransferase